MQNRSQKIYQALCFILSNRIDRVDWASFTSEDWELLPDMAQSEGVAPLVHSILESADAFGLSGNSIVPLVVKDQLAQIYYNNAAHNALLYSELGEILTTLDRAGLPVLLLKGAALAELIYGDIGLRPMVDLDLLVQSGDTDRVILSLLAAGYRRAIEHELRPGFDRQFRVEAELLSPEPFTNVVEIHWRLIGPLFACQHVDHNAIWERAVPVTAIGQPAYTLGAEDWVLHQTAHAFYKHRRITLLNLYDLDRLICHLDKHLDWEKLLKIGKSFHWLPAIAVEFPLCVKLFGTPIPTWVIESARSYHLPRLERWMVNWWLMPGRLERHHIIPDWLVLPGVRAKLQVLWAYLFPDRAYMEAQYGIQTVWQLPFSYIHRLISSK